MTEPKQIADFKEAILASEEIRALVYKTGNGEAKWAAFQRGENLEELYDLISDSKHEGEPVSALSGAAPDDDTFAINISRLGPLYFVKACEFDTLEYFGSHDEAEAYAYDYFSGYIESLKEKEL